MDVWVVIPARLGSTRLPNKPLVQIEGLSLIEHVRRRALQARSVRRVLVATDSPEIARVVGAHGGEVVWTGPAATGTHRVAAAVGRAPVPVINLQGDQPLVDPAHLDEVARALAAGAPLVTLSAPWPEAVPLDDPDYVKVGPGPRFSREPIPDARLHVGIYGFQPEVLEKVGRLPPTHSSLRASLEQLAWLEAGLSIEVVEVGPVHPAVDSPAQLEAVRRALRKGSAVRAGG